jgi:hypothetical protein
VTGRIVGTVTAATAIVIGVMIGWIVGPATTIIIDVVIGRIVGTAAAIRGGVVSVAAPRDAIIVGVMVGRIVGAAALADIAGCVVAATALPDVTDWIVGSAPCHSGGSCAERRNSDDGGERNLDKLAHAFSPFESPGVGSGAGPCDNDHAAELFPFAEKNCPSAMFRE